MDFRSSEIVMLMPRPPVSFWMQFDDVVFKLKDTPPFLSTILFHLVIDQ
jgi:hypothetical protein